MITVCGEGLIDLVEQPGRGYHARPGGSPFNVAVGLARLGQHTSLLTRLGTDRFGRMLRAHLVGNGVSSRDVVEASEPTTLAVVSVEGTGQASYDFYVRATAAWQWRTGELPEAMAPDVRALHTGSLACWLPPGADAVEALLQREHRRGVVTVCLDPNLRPALMPDREAGRCRVERLVELSDVVKVSDEDLAWIHPGADAEAVARDWVCAGPALVVLTQGSRGACLFDRSGTVLRVAARQVAVVDTVGAGDAFTAGLLDGLARAAALGGERRAALGGLGHGALRAVLEHANTVAALACTRTGADPPSRAESHHLPSDRP